MFDSCESARRRDPRRPLAAALILLLLGAACESTPDRTFESFQRRDADVFLVPIGPFAPEFLVDLASRIEDAFSLRVGVTPSLPFDPASYDAGRRQLVAEALIAGIARASRGYALGTNPVFIGVTHTDMYIGRAQRLRFAFSLRQGGRLAVVSAARTAGRRPAEALEILEADPGLFKIVAKTIGMLYYGKATSSDPTSVLYAPILGIDDLERIDERTIQRDILD